MPKFEKLLTDVGPDDPPARAARRALKTRLRAVTFYLDAASTDPAEQAEEIHQLRVWTRRSGAALKLFGPLVPSRKGRKLKKALRRLRQAAGAVRDLDVIESLLGKELHGPLAARLDSQRRTARKDLRGLFQEWGASGKLKRKIKRLLARVGDGRGHPSSNGAAFAPWCREQLGPLVEDFAACAAKGARQSDAGLHRWRLAAKRLRYAQELAVVAIPKRIWSRLYKLLSDLQERIGVICDALAERQRLKQWRSETNDPGERQALLKLDAQCRRRLAAAKQGYTRWWTAQRGKSVAALCRQTVSAT